MVCRNGSEYVHKHKHHNTPTPIILKLNNWDEDIVRTHRNMGVM